MPLEIASRWFEHRRVDDDITLFWEPEVDPLVRCNIWHVRGGERDLLIDTGLGIASLAEAVRTVFEKPVTAVATHSHFDHTGGLHEFDRRIIHQAEAGEIAEPTMFAALLAEKMDPEVVTALEEAGYSMPDKLIAALPHADYDPALYAVKAAPATRIVEEGDVIEAGARRFQILHLPGHSPGSMGLWEPETGTLFSGDAIYDGPLIDNLSDCSLPDYVRTMEKLKALPIRVVHAGHDPSFGRERLHEIADDYLARWSKKLGTVDPRSGPV